MENSNDYFGSNDTANDIGPMSSRLIRALVTLGPSNLERRCLRLIFVNHNGSTIHTICGNLEFLKLLVEKTKLNSLI